VRVETFTAPNIAFVDCGTPGGVAALDFVTAIAITL
jgi:6-phosphogluconate dehydrogenase (decarboxylating)